MTRDLGTYQALGLHETRSRDVNGHRSSDFANYLQHAGEHLCGALSSAPGHATTPRLGRRLEPDREIGADVSLRHPGFT
ncbi:hypothetical protein [Phenylobacterium sp.]|jgi:hypothetical protein|uniref:hypothetical protein n=1 Tax=Phenylobacterium sp. TaxID=1871053 RepID=UPI0037CA4FFA